MRDWGNLNMDWVLDAIRELKKIYIFIYLAALSLS